MGVKCPESLVYIYTLLVCLGVCLYLINVQTAEPIGTKLVVGSRVTPGKLGLWIIKFSTICLHQNSIFENLIVHKPSLGSPDDTQKIWARSVQPF